MVLLVGFHIGEASVLPQRKRHECHLWVILAFCFGLDWKVSYATQLLLGCHHQSPSSGKSRTLVVQVFSSLASHWLSAEWVLG